MAASKVITETEILANLKIMLNFSEEVRKHCREVSLSTFWVVDFYDRYMSRIKEIVEGRATDENVEKWAEEYRQMVVDDLHF